MANKEKLPWDLIEEILSRVPPKSLVRFRTVCKRWNALLDDKTFINNHKTTFRFILATKSKIYSVSVNPTIEVRELTLDIPTLKSQIPIDLIDCDGLLLCDMGKGAVVCNPWLRQSRWIKPEGNETGFRFCGIGYDDDNGYKTLAVHVDPTKANWKTHDFSSDSWKDQKGVSISGGSISSTQEERRVTLHTTSGVSLNGTWYRVASCDRTKNMFFLVNFDFSTEKFYKFCDLPCEDNNHHNALVLRVFRGDRFSLLKQSHITKKIQIWVAKNKIHKRSGRDVEWVNFMEVSIPNLPALIQIGSHSHPSYFIDEKRDDKRLFVCSCDGNGRPWIYVITESRLISRTRLDSVVDPWPLHCAYFPSLVLVPGRQRDEEGALQVRLSFFSLFVWCFRKLKVFFRKINYF